MKANDNVAAPIPMLATTLKSEYPDACDWTIDDVVRFFEELGFKEQAIVFREQVRNFMEKARNRSAVVFIQIYS